MNPLRVLITICLIALAFIDLPAQNDHRFVLAASGLNLRSDSDPGSAKVATIPYGAKVTVLEEPSSFDMKVDNLKGGMMKVSVEGKTGYMFSGYLARYPGPTEYMSVEKYTDLARKSGCTIYMENHHYDYDGYFRQEDGVTLLNGDWQDAFLVARMLGRIPDGLSFPNAKGPKEETIPNPNKPDVSWSDEMTINRDEAGQLTKISYYYRSEGGGSFVNISPSEESQGYRIIVGGIAD